MAVTFGSDLVAEEKAAVEAREPEAVKPAEAKDEPKDSESAPPSTDENGEGASESAAVSETAEDGEPDGNGKRRNRSAERKISHLNRVNSELRAKIEALEGKPAPSAAAAPIDDPDREPKENDYPDDYAAYVSAKTRFDIRREAEAKAFEERLNQARTRHETDNTERCAVLRGLLQEPSCGRLGHNRSNWRVFYAKHRPQICRN